MSDLSVSINKKRSEDDSKSKESIERDNNDKYTNRSITEELNRTDHDRRSTGESKCEFSSSTINCKLATTVGIKPNDEFNEEVLQNSLYDKVEEENNKVKKNVINEFDIDINFNIDQELLGDIENDVNESDTAIIDIDLELDKIDEIKEIEDFDDVFNLEMDLINRPRCSSIEQVQGFN